MSNPKPNPNPNAITVKIFPNDKGSPNGKLCDAELHFDPAHPILGGLKLMGFAVWERRSGGGRNVTFPARTYSVNGERRSFALLRPAAGEPTAQNATRDLVLGALTAYEQTGETSWNPDAARRNAQTPAQAITEPARRAMTAAGDAGRLDSL